MESKTEQETTTIKCQCGHDAGDHGGRTGKGNCFKYGKDNCRCIRFKKA